MHIQPKGNTNPADRFHVPSGIGRALIATGVVEEVKPPVKPHLAMEWATCFPTHGATGEASFEYPPVIHAKCPMCGKWERRSSDEGKALEVTQWALDQSRSPKLPPSGGEQVSEYVFHHFPTCTSKTDAVPADIKARYLKLFKQWTASRDPQARKAADKKKREAGRVALFGR